MAYVEKKKKRSEATGGTFIDIVLGLFTGIAGGLWRLSVAGVGWSWSGIRAAGRWTWRAAGWSVRQTRATIGWTWRAAGWSVRRTRIAIRWSFRQMWAATVWTWRLPGRALAKLRGDNKRKSEAVHRIEKRYGRRFRYFSHLAVFAVIASITWLNAATDPRFNDPFGRNMDELIEGTVVWAVILLIHTIKFLTDEAKDRAIERELERERAWQMDGYGERVLRLSEDGELVEMVEEWDKPKREYVVQE